MSSVTKYGKRWQARWREYPGGPQKAKHFNRRLDAERWLTEVEHKLLTGAYTDPAVGMLTVEQYTAEWLGRRQWRPATVDRVERTLRLWILPTFGVPGRRFAAPRRGVGGGLAAGALERADRSLGTRVAVRRRGRRRADEPQPCARRAAPEGRPWAGRAADGR